MFIQGLAKIIMVTVSTLKLKFHWDQFPRNFLVTSWRLPRNICYGEVTGKLVPVEFELIK